MSNPQTRKKGTFGCIAVNDEFIGTLRGVEPVVEDVIKEIGGGNDDMFLSECHRKDPVEYCHPEEPNQICKCCGLLHSDECETCVEKTWG
ncbi:MAG: hypothetical protein KKA64_02735 [Nanoarchaeota archaeon]|nr:hypothetical protein [Nanoarchaeota archaeon]